MIFQFLKKYRRKKTILQNITLLHSHHSSQIAAIIKIIVKYSRFEILPHIWHLENHQLLQIFFKKQSKKSSSLLF